MSEDRTGQILKLLNELIDLVKKNQPKVENHTHHHYPANPNTWYYPTTTSPWITGSGGNYPPSVTTGGYFQPGSTTTWSTNDPPENGTDTPSE